MRRAGKIVLSCLVAVALWAGLLWGASEINSYRAYGTILDEKTLTSTFSVGDRFALAVPDGGASIGDEWSATVATPGILTEVENRQVMGNVLDRVFGPLDGGGAGTRYFVFTADRQGLTTVRLFDCFQGGCGRPGDVYSRWVTWEIAVR